MFTYILTCLEICIIVSIFKFPQLFNLTIIIATILILFYSFVCFIYILNYILNKDQFLAVIRPRLLSVNKFKELCIIPFIGLTVLMFLLHHYVLGILCIIQAMVDQFFVSQCKKLVDAK